jgi:hypothetical protein
MPIPVTGNGLYTLVEDFNSSDAGGFGSRTRLVTMAGYYSFKPDGSIRYNFTRFYEALQEAKVALGLITITEPEDSEDDEDEEPELSEMAQAVVDKFSEVDEDDAQDFADFLTNDLGIEASELSERYAGTFKNNEEFAEAKYLEMYGDSVPSSLSGHIDWDGVYDDEHYNETEVYEYNGQNYYFRNY